MKQAGHAVDKDAARLLPAGRKAEPVMVQRDIERPLIRIATIFIEVCRFESQSVLDCCQCDADKDKRKEAPNWKECLFRLLL